VVEPKSSKALFIPSSGEGTLCSRMPLTTEGDGVEELDRRVGELIGVQGALQEGHLWGDGPVSE
jgi:hypothetical protein